MFANVLFDYYDATRLQASLASVKESYSIICIARAPVKELQCLYASMQNRILTQVTCRTAAMRSNIQQTFSPSVKYSKAHCIQMTSYLQGTSLHVMSVIMINTDIINMISSLHVMSVKQQKVLCSIWLSTGHSLPPGFGSRQHAFWHARLHDCVAQTTNKPWTQLC